MKNVHVRHCCKNRCSCKYNQEDCPIVNGSLSGDNECDHCQGFSGLESVSIPRPKKENFKKFRMNRDDN